MFAIRTILVLLITCFFVSSVDAQLFRFRRSQPQQYPSNYNASAYRYTQVQSPTSYVPSQQYAQQQVPRCNRQIVYVPVTLEPQTQAGVQAPESSGLANANKPQQIRIYQQSQQQLAVGQVIYLTLKDPQTGETFQRPFVVTGTSAQPAIQMPGKGAIASADSTTQVSPDDSPSTVLSTSKPDGVVTPVLELEPSEKKIATTSFESPVKESEPEDYSVFNTGEPQETKTIELPLLTPADSVPAQKSTEPPVGDPGSLELDLDLPPLESDGS